MQVTIQSLKKRIMSTLLLLAVTSVLFLYNWVAEAVAKAHVLPAVERCDISGIISKVEVASRVNQEELQLLSGQTGLSEATIVRLQQQERLGQLEDVQNIYFAPVTIEEIRTTPLTISEWLAEGPVPGYEGMPLVDIQNGDILITKNSRFLGWRNGHAGLVVDAEKGLVLEAIMLGSPSQLCKIEKWESYPSFLVLRLREEYMVLGDADGESGDTASGVRRNLADDTADTATDATSGNTAENVAVYASEHLVGVPYQLLAGVFSRKLYQVANKGTTASENVTVPADAATAANDATSSDAAEVVAEALSGTQCAHLVWYAYKQFGIDLDSDGGFFVTPYDIQNSPYLEVIQVYGY